MAVPYTFGTATAAIPLSQLDSNFATAITIGNTAVQLGNTVTTLNNMTLANVTISSGTITITNVAVTTANVSGTANVSTLVVVGNETVGGNTTITGNITSSTLTSGRVPYATTSGRLIDSANLLYSGTDLTVYGLTVGRGAGAVSTNTAVGASALAGANTNTNHVAVGYQALQGNTSGGQNVAVGGEALKTNTAGSNNIGIGFYALRLNTGSDNTSVGAYALSVNGAGAYNTAIGRDALTANTSASNNTAVGYQAGYQATGADNTLLGRSAGYTLTSGTQNTFVGYGARGSSASASTQIVIGYDLTGQGDSYVTLGSSTGKVYNAFTVNATWTQTSDGRLKKNIQEDTLGLSFINRLRPVKFTWKPSNELEQDNPYYAEENKRDTTTVIHGLIAQEVKAALDAEGIDTFAGWDMGPDGIQAISREMFISPLIKAIQELKAEVDSLKSQLNGASA